jgi:hypothetical protein
MILVAPAWPGNLAYYSILKARKRGATMRAITAIATSSALFVALAASAFAAPPAAKLAPSDIQTMFFNGQPFTAATTSNVKYKMTFTTDGKMKREPVGAGARGEGTWKLSKDGFCTTWSGNSGNCFTVVAAGDNKWSVLRGSTIMATWSK